MGSNHSSNLLSGLVVRSGEPARAAPHSPLRPPVRSSVRPMSEASAPPAPAPNVDIVDAAKQGKLYLVQAAVRMGVDVNSRSLPKNSSPLMVAARFGHLAVVQLLLEHGAKVNLWDTDYATALDCALQSGSLDIVALLRKHGGQTGSSFLSKPFRSSRNTSSNLVDS